MSLRGNGVGLVILEISEGTDLGPKQIQTQYKLDGMTIIRTKPSSYATMGIVTGKTMLIMTVVGTIRQGVAAIIYLSSL